MDITVLAWGHQKCLECFIINADVWVPPGPIEPPGMGLCCQLTPQVLLHAASFDMHNDRSKPFGDLLVKGHSCEVEKRQGYPGKLPCTRKEQSPGIRPMDSGYGLKLQGGRVSFAKC